MEQIIIYFIYIHAFFGGLGLISGIAVIILQKGNIIHKKMGAIFTYSMLISSLISLPICCLPNHENIFLFLIGVFTIYLIFSGNRAVTFKNKNKASNLDYSISICMTIASLVMAIIGVIGLLQGSNPHILFLFFGSFGIFMVYKDFLFFKNKNEFKQKWLQIHIGRMIGAFIASITAFIVAGLGIGNIIAWIVPSILGTIYIIFWNRKLKRNQS